MKLQISFDTTDINHALDVATQVAPYADILEIGSILIYQHGVASVERFRKQFPDKILLADVKLIDRPKEVVNQFAQAGADWISVMAGTSKRVIHTACAVAEELNVNIVLDLLDAASLGQSALEAEKLGAHALMLYLTSDIQETLAQNERWEMVRGNTRLPIFVSAHIKRDTVSDLIVLKPDGLVIGKSITDAQNPAREAELYKEMCTPSGILFE